jgi:hypothetical protein
LERACRPTSLSPTRRGWGLLLLVLLTIPNAPGAGVPLEPQVLTRTLFFARYIAWLQNRDPFTESGPVAMSSQGSLPGLYKDAELVATRATGEDERSQYLVVGMEGDGAFARVTHLSFAHPILAEANWSLSSTRWGSTSAPMP